MKGEDYFGNFLFNMESDEYRITAEAKSRFQRWSAGDKAAIDPNLRSAVFMINVSEGGRTEFEKVLEEYLTTDSVDGKEIALSALGRTKDETLVREYLDLIFSEKVNVQDIHTGAASLAANSKVRHLSWEYMKTNWSTVSGKLAANRVVAERFIRLALSKYADESVADDIKSFFKDKDTGAYDRALVIVDDSIRTSARYKVRDEKLLLEWLQAHGYA